MDWHTQSSIEVIENLKTSKRGLNEKEVQKRFAKYGKNIIRQIKRKSKLRIFFGQFNSLLVYILIFAVVVSILIRHYIDASIIGIIVIINAIIGFIQEYKAEEIIEKLKKSLKYDVVVIRDGIHKEVGSDQIVPGDIILLNPGDNILADCRILESEDFKVNEAVLTGESFPVRKSERAIKQDVTLSNRVNMLYAGTSVVHGRCVGIVVETGIRTEFGKLAELVQIIKEDKMPLEKNLDIFSRNISIAILILVGITFFVGVSAGINKIEMFLIAVSLAVGAIPEGLPAIIAITLAVAIKQMYTFNTLIRKLPAMETLGRATVICTDKTGTLTEEELQVDEIYAGRIIKMENVKKIDDSIRKVLEIGVLCNNARDEEENIFGDPTEVSLINFAKRFGILKKTLVDKFPKIREYHFASDRKMMSIVREDGSIKTSYVKGAPFFVLEKCTKELIDGKVKPLNEARKKELVKISTVMESSGLRVLGFAFRQVTQVKQNQAENYLTFTGFIGMIDPPRKEVALAIKEAINAGIVVKIITGDSAFTTKAIAEKIGLKGDFIEGNELDNLPEEKWDEVVRTKTIFARMTPEHKLKVVDILKKQNEIVAVTGDGVNDILALKRADVGISMGIRGTDVARDSSDIVLLDDNFASIVGAVKQGRRVFDNIKKSIKFLLSVNVANTFIILTSLLIDMPLLFLPLALLWMNLVTDSLPALALSVEPMEDGIMERRSENRGLLYGIWGEILVAGIINFIMVIWLFNIANNNFGLDVARTMAVTSSVFLAMFLAFSFKSKKSLFETGIINNKYLIYAVLISTGLHLIAIYTNLGILLGFVALNGMQLSYSVLAGLSGIVIFEGWKLLNFFKRKIG